LRLHAMHVAFRDGVDLTFGDIKNSDAKGIIKRAGTKGVRRDFVQRRVGVVDNDALCMRLHRINVFAKASVVRSLNFGGLKSVLATLVKIIVRRYAKRIGEVTARPRRFPCARNTNQKNNLPMHKRQHGTVVSFSRVCRCVMEPLDGVIAVGGGVLSLLGGPPFFLPNLSVPANLRRRHGRRTKNKPAA